MKYSHSRRKPHASRGSLCRRSHFKSLVTEILEIVLTHSIKRRNYFLIATFSALFASFNAAYALYYLAPYVAPPRQGVTRGIQRGTFAQKDSYSAPKVFRSVGSS